MPMNDADSMPPNTGVPTSRRASCDGPYGDDQRQQPQDEGEGCHHHRTEAQPRALGRGLEQRDALGSALLGEFHDQDAVLRRQPDQHDHADLRIEIERQTRRDDGGEGSDNADR